LIRVGLVGQQDGLIWDSCEPFSALFPSAENGSQGPAIKDVSSTGGY